MIEDALSQAQILGGDLQQFIVRKEFKTLLKGELFGRNKAKRLVRPGSARVGQMLGAAYVHGNVVTADHSLAAHYENTILITDGEPEILTMADDI